MRLPIRKTFAALLFLTSLVPLGLVVGFFVLSPNTIYTVAGQGSWWLTRAGWVLLGVLVVALLVYPPFLPFLRLRFGETWRRLGTDKGPMYEGLARLRHLETHADLLLVGRLARQLNDYNLASEHLAKAFELDPSHVSGRYQFGLLLLEIGQLGDAANLLGSVVREDEKHAFGDALHQLGRCLFRLHRDDEALQVLRRHQSLFPGSREVHLLTAKVLADAGDLEQAKTELVGAARPADENEHLSLHENLARARAKVTFLKKGSPLRKRTGIGTAAARVPNEPGDRTPTDEESTSNR